MVMIGPNPCWRGVKHKFLTIKSANLTFIILSKKRMFLETLVKNWVNLVTKNPLN